MNAMRDWQSRSALSIGIACALGAAACGSDSGATGRVQVFLAAEDTIPNGLVPGTSGDSIQDGWTVRYNKFLISVGNFRASRSTAPSDKLRDPRTFVVDMKNLPAGGLVIADFAGAKAVRWDKVGYDLPNASSAAICAEGISPTDCALMKNSNFSIYFEATLTKADGRSCRPGTADCVAQTSQTIRWGLKAGTSFDDCSPPQGDAGFAIPTGGTIQVKPTIHGDHWFFTNITQGAELTERRAQWIVDADQNRDGETTLEELRNTQAAALFRSPPYNLSGALSSTPDCTTLTTAYCYLLAQARTLGDYQGDGECPTRAVLP